MPALVAGIHALSRADVKDVDGRDKPVMTVLVARMSAAICGNAAPGCRFDHPGYAGLINLAGLDVELDIRLGSRREFPDEIFQKHLSVRGHADMRQDSFR